MKKLSPDQTRRLAANLDRLMNRDGWSMHRLSEESEVSYGALRSWLASVQSVQARWDLANQVAETYGVTVDDLIHADDIIAVAEQRKTAADEAVAT